MIGYPAINLIESFQTFGQAKDVNLLDQKNSGRVFGIGNVNLMQYLAAFVPVEFGICFDDQALHLVVTGKCEGIEAGIQTDRPN